MQIQVSRNPFDTDYKLFPSENVVLPTGLTVLVGCNGTGKTTLMRELARNAKCKVFQADGTKLEHHLSHLDLLGKTTDIVEHRMFLSEGESLSKYFGTLFAELGEFVRSTEPAEESLILFDAVDSGISVDTIMTMQRVFNMVQTDRPNATIVVASNGYEMARNNRCMYPATFEIKQFHDYEEWRQFVISSLDVKEKR